MSSPFENIPGLSTPPGPTPPTGIASLAPAMPEQKRSKLSKASSWVWQETGDVSEGDIFERKYREITNFYLAQAATDQMARAVLWLFRMYRPLAEAVCKEFTYSTEKVNGTFVGDAARGAQQTTMRPLVRDTFYDPTLPGLVIDWVQSQPAAAWPAGAALHVIPSRRTWALGSTYAEAVEDEQTYLILGYAEFLQNFPVAIAIHDWINDSLGWRNQNYFYPNHAMSNLMLMQFGSPRWVQTNERYRCDSWVRENKNVSVWPIGVEILIADRVGEYEAWP